MLAGWRRWLDAGGPAGSARRSGKNNLSLSFSLFLFSPAFFYSVAAAGAAGGGGALRRQRQQATKAGKLVLGQGRGVTRARAGLLSSSAFVQQAGLGGVAVVGCLSLPAPSCARGRASPKHRPTNTKNRPLPRARERGAGAARQCALRGAARMRVCESERFGGPVWEAAVCLVACLRARCRLWLHEKKTKTHTHTTFFS